MAKPKFIRQLMLVVSAAVGIAGASPTAAQQGAPVVLVQTVEKAKIHPSFEHPARMEAIQVASVRPILSAQISGLHITAGDIVEQGDLLVELDQTDYKIALAEAAANITQSEANAVKAEADHERAKQLVGRGAVSQRDLDYALASMEVARAQVEIARARLEKAKTDIEHTRVMAPFDGRISAPNFAVGDLYAPGDPTQPGSIAEIVSLDPIYATGLVDQANYFQFLARRLKLEAAGQTIPPLELELILPGGVTYPFKGEFQNWDNTAVASTGSIAARVLFENPDGVLLPGENVTLRGALIDAIDAILVPQRAVSFDQQGHFVWVMGTDSTVTRRDVEVGVRDGANWTIPVGLAEGETVVVEGLQKLRPGLEVTPKPFAG